jgi:hypothetical protein
MIQSNFASKTQKQAAFQFMELTVKNSVFPDQVKLTSAASGSGLLCYLETGQSQFGCEKSVFIQAARRPA